MGPLEKFTRRTPAERRLLVRAFVLVALVRVGLWVLPYRRVRRLVEVEAPGTSAAHADGTGGDAEAAIVWAVEAAGRRVPSASCLTQSLAAQRLLAREGYASTIEIGAARNEAGVFEAHAWLLRDGRVILGNLPDLARFTPLASKRDAAKNDAA